MRPRTFSLLVVASALAQIIGLCVAAAQVRSMQDKPTGLPDVIVDLSTEAGARLVKGQWLYSDTKIIQVESKGPGTNLAAAAGVPLRAYDYTPHAEGKDFDDSGWERISAASLQKRRSKGKVSFNWYRIKVTIPQNIGGFQTAGSTVAFEIVVAGYAEVWVDGKLPLPLGQSGGQVVKGFNAPNRIVVERKAVPGQQIELAVFGINGPISASPSSFIWIRSATLEFYKSWSPALEVSPAKVIKLDPALDAIVPIGAKVEKLADGFSFIEGPVWVRKTDSSPDPGDYLLFSEPNSNLIWRWTPDGDLYVYRTKSGYTGSDIKEYGQPGSNGLTLDKEGRLTINEHGNRRVTRLEKNGALTVLADHYEGKRFNSPNDLVYRSDGALYFTDPPFGLPRGFDDPRKELPYSGVFCFVGGRLKLVSKDLNGPNGLAFSPDEKYLYVDNWDFKKEVIMRYEVKADGSLSNGEVFLDATGSPGDDAWDGMKIDRQGNLYVSGPGGLWIISAKGRHLGTITPPEHPYNIAWGDDDGRTLYMCARTGLYRIRLAIPGIRP